VTRECGVKQVREEEYREKQNIDRTAVELSNKTKSWAGEKLIGYRE
jgi:hypothetical protein